VKWRVAFVATVLVLFWLLSSAHGQTASSAEAQTGVVLVKLSPPVYPPLARQARIAGDVEVNVHVRADGTVASVELWSGHPMLAPAAVESAKNSEYECRGCTGETESILTYTFGFIEDFAPYNRFEERRVPAAKCLYLWKCGVVRVNTFDSCAPNLPQQVSQSPGHVKILAFASCLETMESNSASR
jgi:TonB family protein